MERVIIFLVLLITTTITAQNKAEMDVKKAIDTFFEGFHKGDTLLMKSVMYNNMLTQTTYKDREGKGKLVTDDVAKMIQTIANRPADQKWEERLLDYNIQIWNHGSCLDTL